MASLFQSCVFWDIGYFGLGYFGLEYFGTLSILGFGISGLGILGLNPEYDHSQLWQSKVAGFKSDVKMRINDFYSVGASGLWDGVILATMVATNLAWKQQAEPRSTIESRLSKSSRHKYPDNRRKTSAEKNTQKYIDVYLKKGKSSEKINPSENLSKNQEKITWNVVFKIL